LRRSFRQTKSDECRNSSELPPNGTHWVKAILLNRSEEHFRLVDRRGGQPEAAGNTHAE
jgi:hypothetical protein